MTIVAAVADGHRVVMAADTACNYAGTLLQGTRKIRKFQAGNASVLLAAAGDGALLQFGARNVRFDDAPEPYAHEDVWDEWAEINGSKLTDYMAAATPPLTRPDQSGSVYIDGAFLLGAGGRLWYLFTHQAHRVTDFAAIGSGTDLALGVMAALPDHDPDLRTRRAVEVACQFDPNCAVSAAGPHLEMV